MRGVFRRLVECAGQTLVCLVHVRLWIAMKTIINKLILYI